MKKSDIAIYISAILTLVLTAFVVFSTQKITYESEINKILQDDKKVDNIAINKKKDSALFNTKLPEIKVSDTSLSKLNNSTNTTTEKKPMKSTKSFADLNSVDTIITKATPKKVKIVTKKKAPTFTVAKKIKRIPVIRKHRITRKSSAISRNGAKFYTVKSGDALWKIAKRFNTKTITIIKVNKINNPNLIYPGMRIKLPV